MFFGAKQVLLDSTCPADFLAAVQKERCTRTALVPTLVSRILSFEELDRYDVSSLNKIYVGRPTHRRSWCGRPRRSWACCT